MMDKHGMTPLMHAAWKGTESMLSYLLKQDTLFILFDFRMLLEAGAKAYHINSVNRTAAAMAAFVGNHECVSVINNFVPKDDVWYYTRLQPLEDEPKLPAKLAHPLYKMVMSMNTHPVRISMIVRADPLLLENLDKVTAVLELMSDKEFKHRYDVNEILSLKFHMIKYILKVTKFEKILIFCTKIFFRRFPVHQENFLRQGIKEFPFPESTLFKMLVTNFSHCKTYGEGQTAAEYINGAFNGQKGFKDYENCGTCGEEKAEKKCTACKSISYCNQDCQKLHWFMHKKFCKSLREAFDKREKEAKESEKLEKKEEK
ncbi:ankyrin repeat and MYND domain-containing protein 2 [Eurytemora carolleeae]|uniref:ankyrin repeat and MYND domain-containing protein 2 n=1 Tax=Eurytemora carolleeae TaxID=1294199 RepID=UPI000C760EF1|nr:ankyrin repeat and MYND domain-containing protein 2 [Eurytemora carolleeae]|eukprot:XP_023326943.1 ankyrin repeat and MYND domain-containing protein 2-like [Eurytemora affinis]